MWAVVSELAVFWKTVCPVKQSLIAVLHSRNRNLGLEFGIQITMAENGVFNDNPEFANPCESFAHPNGQGKSWRPG